MAQPRHRIRTTPDFMDFDDEAASMPEKGPEFQLGGERFRCVPMLPAGAMPRLTRIVGINERGVAVTNPDVLRFMEDVICEEVLVDKPIEADTTDDDGDGAVAVAVDSVWEPVDDLERWRMLVDDKRRPIEADRLVKVIRYLIEWYADRPTGPSEQ